VYEICAPTTADSSDSMAGAVTMPGVRDAVGALVRGSTKNVRAMVGELVAPALNARAFTTVVAVTSNGAVNGML
jgi:hypothetical protein